MQHFLHHLTPRGTAGFVLSNGSMSSNQSGEGEIRKNIIEASLVDCIIALPGQLFRSTQIPACLWFLRIADTYRAWRSGAGEYADVPGLCKSAALEEIRRHGHVLTPGRYVGAEPQPDDGEPFQEKMARLASQWREQQSEGQQLDAAIAENLERLGFA